MPDVRLVQEFDFPNSINIDFLLLSDGTLDDTQALATAVIVALGTDRLALSSDVLPGPPDDIMTSPASGPVVRNSTDRGGWWGDMDAQTIWNGWPIGSRLWLLKRSKIVGPQARGGATVTLVEQYIREAIQPFIDLRVASQMDVKAWQVTREQINARVRLYRGPALAVDLEYQILWDEIVTNALANPYAGPSPQLGSRRHPNLLARR